MDATHKVTKNLGGDRLGSESKNNISLHAYNRSTHDLSRAWRSSMMPGALVPFLVEPSLPGDTFSIDLEALVRTMPATAPLYGSYKLQLDVFECPIRLYNGLLHNNMTKIGLNMAQVKLPKLQIETQIRNPYKFGFDIEHSQIATDSLLHYLGLSGFADAEWDNVGARDWQKVERKINAVPILAYYDIYKNYYANKQEEKGVVIVPKLENIYETMRGVRFNNIYDETAPLENQMFVFKSPQTSTPPTGVTLLGNTYQEFNGQMIGNVVPVNNVALLPTNNQTYTLYCPTELGIDDLQFVFYNFTSHTYGTAYITQVFPSYTMNDNGIIELGAADGNYMYAPGVQEVVWVGVSYTAQAYEQNNIALKIFDLQNIDNARISILQNTGLNNEFLINSLDYPYKTLTGVNGYGENFNKYQMNGLAIKTYQSDLFNNWLQTEWLDGVNGINQITAIDTSSGSFTIDALNLANKVYNMLNRIAVSGGSYEDYIETVYTTETNRRAETPIYKGGMSTEIVFEEVVSQSATEDDPLGTLAGKGSNTNKRGGHIEIRTSEPSFIIGIVSITPRLDYSQGNKWYLTDLDTLDDLHKPALDGIGFQDLIGEQLAWYDTKYDTQNGIRRSTIGKVPAWINYMTSFNECHGDFAQENKAMFMTLNRRYEYDYDTSTKKGGIKDVTTYIDPTKFNYTFADKTLDAQNFWVQIGMRIEARRVMSAKIIPNL